MADFGDLRLNLEVAATMLDIVESRGEGLPADFVDMLRELLSGAAQPPSRRKPGPSRETRSKLANRDRALARLRLECWGDHSAANAASLLVAAWNRYASRYEHDATANRRPQVEPLGTFFDLRAQGIAGIPSAPALRNYWSRMRESIT